MRLGASVVLVVGPIIGLPAIARSASGRLGATVDGLLATGRHLSPSLRAAALDTSAAAAKASGAGALDDPTISDNYQFYKDPGVFSAHTIMITQSFPLWGKLDLRSKAALADVDVARGQERAAKDKLDEKIKVAFAQYYLINRDIAVNREIGILARRIQSAASARYGRGGGDQTAVIQAHGEGTTAKIEAVRLTGEKDAVKAQLNVLVGRPADAPLSNPIRTRPLPAKVPTLPALVARARAVNPTLAASGAAISAARSRRNLADKAWYPDLTISGGPIIQTNNQPIGFAATVGLNIPLPWGREASRQKEAAAQLGATHQRYDAAVLEIEGALSKAVAKLRAARATVALLQRKALPQSRATFQTVLANYSQGKGDLTAAITAEQQIHEVDLRLLRAQFDEQVELAAIERLIGGDL